MPRACVHPGINAVDEYLRVADRLLPRSVTSLAITGSAALDAFQPARSDIDVVVLLDDPVPEVWRLRALHLCTAVPSLARAVAARRTGLPGVCNGVYVRAADVSLPVSEIRPVASHAGLQFWPGKGFDVNP